MNKQNVFDLIKQIPMANQSVIERLKGLESYRVSADKHGYLIVEYCWNYPSDDEETRSKVVIEYNSKEPFIKIYGYTLIDMKLWTKLAYCPEKELYECQFENVDGKMRVSDPALFWKQLSFIIEQAGCYCKPKTQKTGFVDIKKRRKNE